MNKKLEKMLELTKKEASLRAKIEASQDVAEVRSLGEELNKVIEDLTKIKNDYAEEKDPAEDNPAPAPAPEASSAEGRSFNPLASYSMNKVEKRGNEDITDSVEYRKAFKNYIATGRKDEIRAVTKTTDTNISTVIPQNLANKILERMEQLGVILNLVTKTSYPVGMSYPVDGLKPTATWVGRNTETLSNSDSGEGKGSTPQGKTLGALITFAHYKLRCEIRMTEEVSTMTLPMFEALFVKQVSEAMVRAQEFAVVEGDGYGMPTGILNETAPEGQALTTKSIDYKTLCEAEGAIPAEYEGTTKWCMSKKTFMSFIGMVDTNGQPVARINYGIAGKPERTLLGRDVVIYSPQANSKLKTYSDSLAAGSIFAFLFDFSDYVLNENYNLGIQHAVDWDNEDHKTKAVLACDGKVLIKDSLITLAKKA